MHGPDYKGVMEVQWKGCEANEFDKYITIVISCHCSYKIKKLSHYSQNNQLKRITYALRTLLDELHNFM